MRRIGLFALRNKAAMGFIAVQAVTLSAIRLSTEVADYGARHPEDVERYGRYSRKLFELAAIELKQRLDARFAGPKR